MEPAERNAGAGGELVSSTETAVHPNAPAVWITRLEWLVALLVTAFSIALHVRFVTNVGGLWRDETNSLNLAALPSLSEIWRFLEYDSFPILYFFVLRLWTGVFGAGNDAALRVLGLIVGLAIIGILWANARAFRARVPVLSIALLGLNPMFIRYGDSVRAYGLGILLVLLTLRSFWRLVEQPSVMSGKRIVMAALWALLSVHCLYYNSVLLLAIAVGAVAVAARARAWRAAGVVLAIGASVAVSLLPYAPMMVRMREWTFFVNFPCSFPWLWKRASEVMGSPLPEEVGLWTGLFLSGLSIVVAHAAWNRCGRSRTRSVLANLPAPVLFAAITLCVGVIGYSGFLRMLNYYTQPWYYITLAAFAACTLDVSFGAWPSSKTCSGLRCVRIAVAAALLCFAAGEAWEQMPVRHTNVDLLAARLTHLAKEEDLILVPRWECAISFWRYYYGAAEVITLPTIEDHRFHRYDLLLEQMKASNGYQLVLTKIETVLRSGHRVFIAGELPYPDHEVRLPASHPAFRDERGVWHGLVNSAVWQVYIGQFLRVHATGAVRILVRLPQGVKVQGFENLDATVVEGWR